MGKRTIVILMCLMLSLTGCHAYPETKVFEGKKATDIVYDKWVYGTASLLESVSYLFYGHTSCVEYMPDNQYIYQLEYLEDWPLDGVYTNYTTHEMFYPFHLFMTQELRQDKELKVIYVPKATVTYDNTELYVMKYCKKIADAIQKKYPDATNQEKMSVAAAYLRSISKYSHSKYKAYNLLKNGEGNCTAYSDCIDCIAKFLYIPSVQVDSDKENHMWNIFIGSDGDIYQIDATNGYEPEKGTLISTAHFAQFEYRDTELKLLAYEDTLIALYLALENKPSSYIFDNASVPSTITLPSVKKDVIDNTSDNVSHLDPKVLTLCQSYLSDPDNKDKLWALIVALMGEYSKMR